MTRSNNTLGRDLERTYERRFEKQTEYRNRVWKALTAGYFQRLVSPSAVVLDLGCGYGQFINNVIAEKKYAMDLNPRSQQNLESAVVFIEQDCSKRWPLEDGALDVIFTSNFLEHLPDKEAIRHTLEEAHRCLAPGGKFICLGPNVRYVPGAYWDFWDHHVALSDRSMSEVLELCGFVIETKIPRFLPFTMAEGPAAPVVAIHLYLRLPIAWRLFGKQFLIVATGKVAR
jgi:SAM-dependent methyltransferase